MNRKPYKLFKLKNGLTVVFQSIPSSETVTVCLGVKAGSRYESKKASGLAHFLEHMLFEGTKSFPNSQRLAEFLESVGGKSGAYTDREHVIYNVKILKNHLKIAFKYLSEIIFNSNLDLSSIEREKGIIIEERKRTMDNPEAAIWEDWSRWVFGKDQSLGRSILGEEKTVRAINRLKLQKYLRNFYTPNNMVIVIVGNFPFKMADKYVSQFFCTKELGKITVLKNEKFISKKMRTKVIQASTRQTQLLLGFVTDISYFHKDRYAMRLLTDILSGGVSARLFDKLVYKLGIAYSTGTTSLEFFDKGVFYIYGGFAKENIKKALKVILGELKKITEKSVNIHELNSAKEQSKAQLCFYLENPDFLADFYARQLVTEGKIITREEILESINKVSPDDIKRITAKYFKENKPFILIRGSVGL